MRPDEIPKLCGILRKFHQYPTIKSHCRVDDDNVRDMHKTWTDDDFSFFVYVVEAYNVKKFECLVAVCEAFELDMFEEICIVKRREVGKEKLLERYSTTAAMYRTLYDNEVKSSYVQKRPRFEDNADNNRHEKRERQSPFSDALVTQKKIKELWENADDSEFKNH